MIPRKMGVPLAFGWQAGFEVEFANRPRVVSYPCVYAKTCGEKETAGPKGYASHLDTPAAGAGRTGDCQELINMAVTAAPAGAGGPPVEPLTTFLTGLLPLSLELERAVVVKRFGQRDAQERLVQFVSDAQTPALFFGRSSSGGGPGGPTSASSAAAGDQLTVDVELTSALLVSGDDASTSLSPSRAAASSSSGPNIPSSRSTTRAPVIRDIIAVLKRPVFADQYPRSVARAVLTLTLELSEHDPLHAVPLPAH
eukprot:g9256.t1